MTSKNTSAVDIDMLIMALQADDITWLLDTHNGEVMPGPMDDEEQPETSSRYINIDPLPTEVLITLMESFVATIEENQCAQKLLAALKRQQSDWHFKQALAEYPESEDNWYAFKEQFYALQARQWLRDRNLQARTMSDESTATSPDINEYLDTNEQPVLLSMLVQSEETFRYVLWQSGTSDDEFTLTAYDENDNVLAEVSINRHQQAAIENILNQPPVKLEKWHESGKITTQLRYTSIDGEVQISGIIKQGNWLDRLQSSLGMLLGLPTTFTW